MKQKHFINFHKGITFLGILLLIAAYQQWDNPTAWVYLALHGGYGLLWVLKSYFFPDRQWEQPTNLLYGLVILVGLTTYWIAPWLLMVRSIQAPPSYLAFCVSMYIFGTFLHFASDMQKYTELKLSPEHLVNTGLWAHVRNPNYFGELLIYTGFGLLAMHWLPIAVLIAWIIFVWMPNMRKKDRSLSRYPEFASYKAHTKLFIPYIF
jgi:steroid 5-alpha reductase family enzyme